MLRCCSQCGSKGHNSRTCASAVDDSSGEIMLFGVRVKVDPMRKSVSMNNLSQYQLPHESSNADGGGGGYASADDAIPHQSSGSRERKRGVPWTEEEHKRFLLGLQKVGKGDWRGISRNFVKTRTPTQVASHAQKYFLRRSNLNRRRRRSSLFDITTDSFAAVPIQEERILQDNTTQPVLLPQPLPSWETTNVNGFLVAPFPVAVNPVLFDNAMEKLTFGRSSQAINAPTALIRPIPVIPMPNGSTMVDFIFNQKFSTEPSPVSLKLSLSSDQNQSSSTHSAYQVTSTFNNGDGLISVA